MIIPTPQYLLCCLSTVVVNPECKVPQISFLTAQMNVTLLVLHLKATASMNEVPLCLRPTFPPGLW